MADRGHSDSNGTQNVIDCVVNEHKNDLERDTSEGTAPSEAESAQTPYSEYAEVVLELERYRAQLRDQEKTLVNRIADVDDDRRATASRLQRTWKTQLEEIDLHLRRRARLIAGLLILFAAALLLVYHQVTTGQLEVAAAVSELREELAQSSGEDAADLQARERLERLAAEVREIASSLERLVEDDQQETRASLATESADRTRSERAFGAEQRHLPESLESLRLIEQTVEPGLAGAHAKTADDITDESEKYKAGAPIPATQHPPAEPAAQAGEVSSPETEDETAAASQERNTDASGSEATVVLAQDKYALQLIGVFNQKSLQRFVAREGLPARIYTIRRTHKNRPWSVVIHSLHKNYAAAAEALSRLPSDLAALDPWIRPLLAGVELQIIETRPEQH